MASEENWERNAYSVCIVACRSCYGIVYVKHVYDLGEKAQLRQRRAKGLMVQKRLSRQLKAPRPFPPGTGTYFWFVDFILLPIFLINFITYCAFQMFFCVTMNSFRVAYYAEELFENF